MRILTRAEFLALPEETVFAKYSTFGNFGEIEIKGETAGENIDYWYQPLAEAIDSENSNEWADTVTAAEKGTPFKLDLDCMSRDGMFDQQARFVVWDQDDVKQLIERLQRCVTSEPPPGYEFVLGSNASILDTAPPGTLWMWKRGTDPYPGWEWTDYEDAPFRVTADERLGWIRKT